ncbi:MULTISPECIES: type III secretion system chaperone family protein [Nostoc]|uniref:YbjN domain-containing protein n=2 Tax=Nostoc TaxID=1177 RepID=A0ABR8I587_9NOSO|nr:MULTISPECIES: YbjN domain-containing protein [Nostoc]MBD2561276.1 YbjN domain-containing protein [Nostoc linckia FACHB-391]MBD2646039.1 YbjN domain-containing protein [Nostoc foliaceum FACHB-393]
MAQMFETVIKFFEEDNWLFEKLEGESALGMGFQGDNGEWSCYALVREEQKQFIFYSVSPLETPKEKRFQVAEFLTRANYGMMVGNFELDFADGEVRYKTSVEAEVTNLNSALIKTMVYTNLRMMDKYLPVLMSVIDGDLSPTEAIAQVEG